MPVTLVFMVPFEAELSRPAAQSLASALQLTLTRTDDWDVQVGFRLIGRTGAIRFFRRPTGPANEVGRRYECLGTATDWQDRREVADQFQACLQAVRSIEGRIDDEHVIDPGHSIELPDWRRARE